MISSPAGTFREARASSFRSHTADPRIRVAAVSADPSSPASSHSHRRVPAGIENPLGKRTLSRARGQPCDGSGGASRAGAPGHAGEGAWKGRVRRRRHAAPAPDGEVRGIPGGLAGTRPEADGHRRRDAVGRGAGGHRRGARPGAGRRHHSDSPASTHRRRAVLVHCELSAS